jgi:hypothetical protein
MEEIITKIMSRMDSKGKDRVNAKVDDKVEVTMVRIATDKVDKINKEDAVLLQEEIKVEWIKKVPLSMVQTKDRVKVRVKEEDHHHQGEIKNKMTMRIDNMVIKKHRDKAIIDFSRIATLIKGGFFKTLY